MGIMFGFQRDGLVDSRKMIQSPVMYFYRIPLPWWRHQMETFSALLAICAGNSPVPGEFPAKRPVTRSFDVFFDLHPNKRLSKQWWGWWFKTPSCPIWRHCNDIYKNAKKKDTLISYEVNIVFQLIHVNIWIVSYIAQRIEIWTKWLDVLHATVPNPFYMYIYTNVITLLTP